MKRAPDNDKIRSALESFIRTIEATGGLIRDREGYTAPVGDPDWIDLGDAYLEACEALKRKPLLKN